MTIGSSTNRNAYTGNGSNVSFTYSFKIFSENDIAVYSNGVLQTITTHYTVSGVGNDNGGTVTFLTAPASGISVVLLRNEPFTQDIDYEEGDNFPSAAHEEGLDRSVIRDQQLQETLDRAVTLPESSGTTNYTIEDPVGNSGRAVVVNSGETGLTYTSLVDSTVVGNYTIDTFDGTGSQTDFTLSSTVITQNALLVHVGGAYQLPGTDFTATGNVISFTVAPGSGTNNVEVVNQVQSAATTTPADGSVTTVKVANNAITEPKISDTLVNEHVAITTLQDADQFLVADNSDSDNNRKITKLNLSTALQSDFIETGTWTPALTSTGASFTYDPTTGQVGDYIKVGNLVFIQFRIELAGAPTGTTTNGAFISGIPFTMQTSSNMFFGGGQLHFTNTNLTAGYSDMKMQGGSAQTVITLAETGDAVGEKQITAGQFSGASTFIRGSFTYISA
ncbi:MAG: hypothetical protein MI745_14035 [Pseudomonadales bacterium]|nr:hypothetical protein [Pseudomonadales bacterium]